MIVSQSAQLPNSRGREIVRARGDTGRLSATSVDVLDAMLIHSALSGPTMNEVFSTITTGDPEGALSVDKSSGRAGVARQLLSGAPLDGSKTVGLVLTAGESSSGTVETTEGVQD